MMSRCLVLLFALAAIWFLGCSKSHQPLSRAVPDGAKGVDLLGPTGQATFDVTFDWPESTARDNGAFAWRQKDGMRRWDFFIKKSEYPAGGNFSIASDFPEVGLFAKSVESCVWYRKPSDPDVNLSCGHGDSGGDIANQLVFLPQLRVKDILPQRTIAGRTADCYSFGSPTGSDRLCLDTATKVPLAFEVRDTDGSILATVEAISVSEDVSDFVPANLPVDKASPAVPIASLKLPGIVKG
jgi:hypothetical protein